MIGSEVIDWKGLQALGWPYSRSHTWRLMAEGKFVQCFKLGGFRNCGGCKKSSNGLTNNNLWPAAPNGARAGLQNPPC